MNNNSLVPNFLNPYGFGNFQNPQQVGNSNVVYESVSGFQAVREYQIPMGKVGLLFDDSKNEFYWKDVDSHGMQSLRRFKYEEIPLPADSAAIAESNQKEILNLTQRLSNMELLLSQIANKNDNRREENRNEYTSNVESQQQQKKNK